MLSISVVLFVYNRPEHTRKTLENLSKNSGIDKFDFYVFSDGPKNISDEENVKSVRKTLLEFSKSIHFRTFTVYESNKNKGLANSVIEGVTSILTKYDSVIVLEDDLLTSTDFTDFMQSALVQYESSSDVWSISGYTFHLKSLSKYDYDVYASYRASSWGWATWKNRWDLVDWKLENYQNYKSSKKIMKKFNRGGSDLSKMLELQMTKKIDSWAIRWVFSQSLHNKITVYPKFSKIMNIGMDGTGTHSRIQKDYDVNLVIQKNISFPNQLRINREIATEFKKKFKKSFFQRLLNKFRKLVRKFTIK